MQTILNEREDIEYSRNFLFSTKTTGRPLNSKEWGLQPELSLVQATHRCPEGKRPDPEALSSERTGIFAGRHQQAGKTATQTFLLLRTLQPCRRYGNAGQIDHSCSRKIVYGGREPLHETFRTAVSVSHTGKYAAPVHQSERALKRICFDRQDSAGRSYAAGGTRYLLPDLMLPE